MLFDCIDYDICIIFLQNVHHAGQPMPGEDQEDIVMTSTEINLLNITCPISGKPVVDIEEPVRRYECISIVLNSRKVYAIVNVNWSILYWA